MDENDWGSSSLKILRQVVTFPRMLAYSAYYLLKKNVPLAVGGLIAAIALFGFFVLGARHSGRIGDTVAIQEWLIDLSGSWVRVAVSLTFIWVLYAFARYQQSLKDIEEGRPTWAQALGAPSKRRFYGAVLGIGGTGKTTLVEYLSFTYMAQQLSLLPKDRLDEFGDEDLVKHVYDSNISLGGAQRQYKVTGGTKRHRVAYERDLIDVPGQIWKYGGWSEHFDRIFEKDQAVVVNTMTYGYNATIRRIEQFENLLPDYVERMRREELNALKYVVGEIKARVDRATGRGRRVKTNLTFINWVNMASYWWDENKSNKVRDYYTSSAEFSVLWRDLEAALGPKLTLHRYVPASLLFDDMTANEPTTTCRKAIFCAQWNSKMAVTGMTGLQIGALRRQLYGRPGPFATEAAE